MAIFLFFSTIITVVGAISTLGGLAYDPRRLLWGFTCNAILLVRWVPRPPVLPAGRRSVKHGAG